MAFLIFRVVITFFIPLLVVVVAISIIHTIYSLAKNQSPNFSRVRNSFLSALLFELLFAFAALILVILFSKFVAPIFIVLVTLCAAFAGSISFIYFFYRGTPAWCHWSVVGSLFLWPPR